MYRLLILTSKKGPALKYLTDYVSENIKDIASVDVAKFSDIYIKFDEKELQVKIGKVNVKKYDLVYIRRSEHDISSFAATFTKCLENLEIKYFDKWLSVIGSTGDKMTSLVMLRVANFPVIPSTFNMGGGADMKFPFICKEIDTQYSKGIFVIRRNEDLSNLPKKNIKGRNLYYIHQKFIEIEREYRLLVMGQNVVSVQKMYRDLGGFSASIDHTRKEEFLNVADFDKVAKDIAVNAANLLNIQIAGVDIAYEKGTGKCWLLEVNPGPGFTYDVKISPEIPELAKFLRKEIENS